MTENQDRIEAVTNRLMSKGLTREQAEARIQANLNKDSSAEAEAEYRKGCLEREAEYRRICETNLAANKHLIDYWEAKTGHELPSLTYSDGSSPCVDTGIMYLPDLDGEDGDLVKITSIEQIDDYLSWLHDA